MCLFSRRSELFWSKTNTVTISKYNLPYIPEQLTIRHLSRWFICLSYPYLVKVSVGELVSQQVSWVGSTRMKSINDDPAVTEDGSEIKFWY